MEVFSRSTILLCRLFVCLLCCVSLAHAQKKQALLVGVNQYDHANLAPLRSAERDASELGALLQGNGFQTTILIGKAATKSAIDTALNVEVDRFQAGDTLIVFFAGHGLQFEGINDGFFCPVDARPSADQTQTLVSLKDVYASFTRAFRGTKVMLIDACRNDPGAARGGLNSGVNLDPPNGVAALFSCSAGEQSFEGQQNGLFTQSILECLKNPAFVSQTRQGITWHRMLEYVKDRTEELAQKIQKTQRPDERVLGLAGVPILVTFNNKPADEATADRPTDPKINPFAALASEIKKFLSEQSTNRVNLGPISGPNPAQNAGPGFAMQLANELRKQGIEVEKVGAPFTIKGEYLFGEQKPDAKEFYKVKSLIIELKIIDQQGSRVFETKQSVVDETLLLSALGATLQLSSTPQLKAPNTLRSKEIAKQILNPSTAIEQGAVRAQNGLLSMEVLVNENPVPATQTNGQAYVSLQNDQPYAIRLTNHHATMKLAVQLTIDGVSVFTFADLRMDADSTKPLFQYYLIPPGQKLVVPGWFRTTKRAEQFVITSYGKSVAASLGKQADSSPIGVITATYSACWNQGERPPADETANRQSTEIQATGRGVMIETNFVQVNPVYGSPRGSVSIRYHKPEQGEK